MCPHVWLCTECVPSPLVVSGLWGGTGRGHPDPGGPPRAPAPPTGHSSRAPEAGGPLVGPAASERPYQLLPHTQVTHTHTLTNSFPHHHSLTHKHTQTHTHKLIPSQSLTHNHTLTHSHTDIQHTHTQACTVYPIDTALASLVSHFR